MMKLPFRYVLSSVYVKLLFDDVMLAMQGAAAAGWHHLLIFLDPAMQFLQQQQHAETHLPYTQKVEEYIEKELGMDEDALRVVKEVCVDLKLGEINVIMWNRMNAGYVFRRIYLPAEWKNFLSEEELKAIVGHELGHQKMGADSFIPMRLINRMGDEFLFTLLPFHMTGYFLFLMTIISENLIYMKALSLTLLFRLVHTVIENFFAKKDEYRADHYGKTVTSAQTMKNALKKIDIRAKLEILLNLDQLPHAKQVYYRWLLKKEEGLLREALLDHPFLHKRIEALKV